METIALDPQRQEKAKIYARLQRRFELLDLALGGLYVLAWLVFGWSALFRGALEGVTGSPWLVVAAYGAVFAGVYLLLDLPLSFYTGYTLPRRFDISNQTLAGWLSDLLKSLLVSAPLGLLFLELIYALLRAAPQTWWLWAALALVLFTILLANLAPVLIMPLFNKYVPLGEEHADLAERLLRLAERAHTHVQGVYTMDMSRRTQAANAALTGLGNTRRIILGDTLIENFTSDEIETVLAHELGHQVHKDIPLGMAVNSLTTLLGLYLASLVLDWGAALFGLRGPADVAALPVFLLAMGVYGLITMPLGNAWSRWRERLADEYALQSTRNGGAFASALTRLANQNLSDADPEPWVEIVFYSHPALSKRIAMAQGGKEKDPKGLSDL